MSKFEQEGVNRQYSSKTKSHAILNFQDSCNYCCTIGRCTSCDRCVIAGVHYDMIHYVLNT